MIGQAMGSNNIVILHNIVTPYRNALFSEIARIHDDFKVIFIAETEIPRDWIIDKGNMQYDYEILYRKPLESINKLNLVARTFSSLRKLNAKVLIIAGYDSPAFWTALLWKRLYRRKAIILSASNEEDRRRIFLREMLKRRFIRNCDAAIVYGSKGREYIRKLGMCPGRIFLMGNSVDNEFYWKKSAEFRLEKHALRKELALRKVNILYVGRFSKEKNLIFLLDCINSLPVDDKKVCGLVMVGSGPLMGEVQDYVQKHNMKNVYLAGFKQKEELALYYGICDVLVLPSLSETWGLVVNEAMASGLPIIVSRRCGCYPDIIKEGINGFSFDPHNKEELMNHISNMVKGVYDLKGMGKASRSIIDEYSPAKTAERLLEAVGSI
ncbi:MAG: glycosyltransferase [bacterium]